MADRVADIITWLKSKRWIAIVIVIFLVMMAAADFTDSLRKIGTFFTDVITHFQNRKLTDEELKKEARGTAKALIRFVEQRQAAEPAIDFDNWSEYTQANIRFSQQTMNLYYHEFAPKVLLYREEFMKRGLRNEDLDMFYGNPTNYLGMRALAVGLYDLANKL